MTDYHASGRFDVLATGELSGDFDGADERARLLRALNADHDLCSALLCGEQPLLCSGVEWPQAQAFAALMRDCGVMTRVVRHGEVVAAEPVSGRPVDIEAVLGTNFSTLDDVSQAPGSAELGEEQVEPEITGAFERVPTAELRSSVVYDAEVVDESEAPQPLAQRTATRAEDVVMTGEGDIPRYLLEADARERNERRRQQRRWGLASLLVLLGAMAVIFSGGEEVYSSREAYVHVLADVLPAGAEGVIAELLVEPGQQLERGEAVAVIAPAGGVQQRHIEVAPASGTVDQIGIGPGQSVRRGEPLLTMVQPGSAYLLVYFTPEQLSKLPAQGVVQIEFDDFPGQRVLGRLGRAVTERRTGGGGDARTPVRIDFDDQLPLLQRLRSGMAASVTIRRRQPD